MIIIIGTGLAGYQLAREFRKNNATAEFMLITADEGRFYSKPLLSTALTQKKTADTLTTATAETMAAQLNATIKTRCKVQAIDPIKKNIVFDQETMTYDKLVLACGADVIKPPLTGNAVDQVISINHIYDYQFFQELLPQKKSITILGAGLIGCEFANDLTNAGYKVHVIAPVKAPLDLLVPTEIGKLLQTALEKNGAQFHLNCVADRIDKTADNFLLTLSNGETLETELVLSAIGLRPHLALAKTAGIKTDRGILVNRFLETSHADIYALGDCAEVEGHVLPFITPLLNSARALAKTLAGERTAVDYPAMPVTVKTPAHPLVICPPPRGMQGQWQIEQQDNDVRALFYDTQQKLYGFILTNNAVKERMSLAKEVPALF